MMNYKTKSTIIYVLGTLMVIIGATFKIMHIKYGLLILIIGFVIGPFGSFFEIKHLKEKIKKLEQQLEKKSK